MAVGHDDNHGHPGLLLRLRRNLHDVQQFGDQERFTLGDRCGEQDTTDIVLAYGNTGVEEVTVRRPAHSYFPVIVHIDDAGRLTVADTMAFMHDVVRQQQLQPDLQAQRDHLLFGRPAATGLVDGLHIVDHGQQAQLRRTDGRWEFVEQTQYDAFDQDAAVHWKQGVDEFARRLHNVIDTIAPTDVLFSGGVDSTLVRSLLQDDVRLLTARIPGEQFAPEVEQAGRAARLFDDEHRLIDVDHYDYLDLLVDVTQTTGLPCPAMQHVLQTQAASEARSAACYGELGDGTYGFPIIGPSLRQWFDNAGLEPSEAAARQFSLASMRDDDHSFTAEIEQVYGAVDAAHRRRSERVSRLVDWSDRLVERGSDWEKFVVCGHITDMITVGCIRFVRDVAASRGVTLHTPLMERPVIDCFHRFDPATRYRDGERVKPVLKALLQRRVVDYPVDRTKLASGLPRSWYFTDGPLSTAFDRFPPPSPMAQVVRRAVENPQWHNSWILWPALSYSVWYHRWFSVDQVGERDDRVEYDRGTPMERSPRVATG